MSDINSLLCNFNDYARTYLKIKTKNGLLTTFIQNCEQRYISYLLYKQKKRTSKVRTLILKGRQVGITTLVAARAMHYIATNKNVKGLSLTHKMQATINIYNIMARFYNNLPIALKPQGILNKHKSIELSKMDSSYIYSSAHSEEVARGETLQFIHGSEVAFWSNENNVLSSLLLTVPDLANTEVILESTSKGTSGIFYEMCMEAMTLRNDNWYQLIFIPWWWHKEYQDVQRYDLSQSWLDYGKANNLSEEQINWAYAKNSLITNSGDLSVPSIEFLREFPASINDAFKYSNFNILIPHGNIKAKIVNKKEINQLKQNINSNDNFHPLILGVDIATTGEDYTWIIDKKGPYLGFNINHKIKTANTMEIVGIIKNYIENYKPTKVCIDAGGGGIGVYDRLNEQGFKNITLLVYFGAKANNEKSFLNRRAEMWFNLKEFLTDEKNYLVNDSQLIKQICSVEYFYNSNGKIQLEKKENVKKRLKQSPDGADAAALTFAINLDNLFKYNSYQPRENNNYDPFTW